MGIPASVPPAQPRPFVGEAERRATLRSGADPACRTLWVIGEDRPARRRLTHWAQGAPELVAQVASGTVSEAYGVLQHGAVDVAFVALLPTDLTGLGLVEALAPRQVGSVVLVCEPEESLLRFLRRHELDHLVWPCRRHVFQSALRAAVARLAGPEGAGAQQRLRSAVAGLREWEHSVRALFSAAPGEGGGVVVATSLDQATLVPAPEIAFAEREALFTRVCTLSNQTYLVRDDLDELQRCLGSEDFHRVGPRLLVNVRLVAAVAVESAEALRLTFRNGGSTTVSRMPVT